MITSLRFRRSVSARNIILFTLLEENTPSSTVWDIFYHFKLSEHASGVLVNQARKLVQLSETLDTWRTSKYGSFLMFVDHHSLLELQRYWNLYAKFPQLPTDRLERLKKQQTAISEKLLERLKTGINVGASRSATLLWRDAVEPVSDQFGQYWRNGTTATTNKDIQKTTILNPTFCYSHIHGEAFDVYDVTFPQGYHFASAFAPVEVDPIGSNVTSAMAKAKQQFKASCLALQASRKANALKLRFFVGDAIALCKALESYAKSGEPKTEVFAAPWRAAPIDLTEHAASESKPPVSFDVIDTSMLVGFLGIPTILLATQPLLKKRPASQAVMYMDISLPVSWSVDNLVERLGGDIPTLGLLMGLVPRPAVSVFTSHSNTHEHTMRGVDQLFERIAWVEPTGGDKHTHSLSKSLPSIDALDLAKVMFTVYRQMFYKDCIPLAQMGRLPPEVSRMYSSVHADRSTVAAFWVHVRDRLLVQNGTWETAINSFMSLVKAERENWMGITHYVDLILQFRLRGFPFRDKTGKSQQELSKLGVFEGWPDIPRVVCVVFTVPRSSLDPLRNDREDNSPRFVCYFKHSDSDHVDMHSSINAVWGRRIALEGSDTRFAIQEDPDGFRGVSDLVVSFWVDSNTLAHPNLEISFALRFTPLTLMQYGVDRRKTGDGLGLFATHINDKQHVVVLRELPMGFGQTQRVSSFIAPPPITPSNILTHQVTAVEKDERCSFRSMETRLELESEAERAAVSSGTKVITAQIGPCTVKISVGQTEHIVRYPYPISSVKLGVRTNKKAHQVDLSVPFLDPIESGGYPFDPFPLLEHGNFSPWNLHHVYLDRMPKLSIRNTAKLRWLVDHTAIQMSDRERFVQHCTRPDKRYPSDILVNIKESITALIQVYTGLRQPSHTIFALRKPEYGIYMGICVSGLRLDLAAATVVLDAAVIPWSPETTKCLDPKTPIYAIETRDGDVAAWKRLLAACVERCRTWSHGPNCEYKSTGSAPLSTSLEENPLCSCGRGPGFDSADWKVAAWDRLLSHGTRAAISPLFGVSYLDSIVGPGMKLQDAKQPVSWDEPTNKCWMCGRSGRVPIPCPKCKKAKYCSRDCQRKHKEAEHKYVCKVPETV
ncbi:hypothetical protein FS749_003953 [Ceratobasidium sp. UAMH 11750]|nr:hypothetical protein FS749_003953 [Ceratobasidium sp. UAMH 11750]